MPIQITLPSDKTEILRHEFDACLDGLRFRPGGVYVLYDERGACIYVGQSKSLPDRLRTHFASSPFASEIYKIVIYFAENPYEREIYETYAINTFGGRYNRAKKFDRGGANPLLIPEIDEIYYEIEELQREEADLSEELRDINFRIDRRPPRRYNRWTGDLTDDYLRYLDEMDDRTEEDEEEERQDRAERRRILRRLREIKEETRVLREKLTYLFREVAA